MKIIDEITIWQNGQNSQGKILNTSATNVILNSSASFWYGIYSQDENLRLGNLLSEGYLNMDEEDYLQWQNDSYAWDWVANKLSLTIIGDYIPPFSDESSELLS